MHGMIPNTIRAAGRDWKPAERARLVELISNSEMTLKEIARFFGVNVRSLRSPSTRLALGMPIKLRCGSTRMRGRLNIPKNVHPLVRETFAIMNRERATQMEVAERAGYNHHTLTAWKRNRAPSIPDLEATLNVLGYSLKIVPIDPEPSRHKPKGQPA